MTTIKSVPDHGSITDTADLPRPDTASLMSSDPRNDTVSPRPLPSVIDSGRIKFGAACRPPLRK